MKLTIIIGLTYWFLPLKSQNVSWFKEITFEEKDRCLCNDFGKAQIIMLGEQSHGDGTAFQVKAKLVRKLIDECGFNTILFEQDFYKLYVLNNHTDAKAYELKDAFYPIWHTKEILGLVNYALKKENVNIGGIDLQHYYSIEVVENLKNLLSDYRYLQDFSENASRFLMDLSEVITHPYSNRWSGQKRASFIAQLNRLKERISESAIGPKMFWEQEMENLISYVDFVLKGRGGKRFNVASKIRDLQMSKNVQWFFEKRYPGSKVIVWAHNMHIISKSDNGKYMPMGEYLKGVYGDKIAAVCFISSKGEYKLPTQKKSKKIKIKKNSLSGFLMQNQFKQGIVDLRKIENKKKFKYSYLKYYVHSKKDWEDYADFLFYIPIMKTPKLIPDDI